MRPQQDAGIPVVLRRQAPHEVEQALFLLLGADPGPRPVLLERSLRDQMLTAQVLNRVPDQPLRVEQPHAVEAVGSARGGGKEPSQRAAQTLTELLHPELRSPLRLVSRSKHRQAVHQHSAPASGRQCRIALRDSRHAASGQGLVTPFLVHGNISDNHARTHSNGIR